VVQHLRWLSTYSSKAAITDSFLGRGDHLPLLAAGLFGEAGSILAEIKKMKREAAAYPGYRHRLTEELGDFLWYFVRIVSLCKPSLMKGLSDKPPSRRVRQITIGPALDLGSAAGQVLKLVQKTPSLELEKSGPN
jgi:NTP pyrophosphatase (non-canonical NTP hydrolase)